MSTNTGQILGADLDEALGRGPSPRTWAPDFGYGGTPYPSQGKAIGPAWAYAWDKLADGQVMARLALAAAMAEATDVSEKTAGNLLGGAVKAGLLLVHSRGEKGRQFLVRADRYYAQFPEEAPEGYQPPRPPEEGS